MIAVAALTAACGPGEWKLDPGNADHTAKRAQLWTLFQLEAALFDEAPVARAPSFPDGFPADTFLERASPTTSRLKVIPAFSEGEAAAYVLSDLWVNFPEVWVQPWYYLVTAWDNRTPMTSRLKGADGMNVPPVFDVGPNSLFYSPFWQIQYAVVKPDADPQRYTSARAIFEDRLPVHASTPWIYTVRPETLTLPTPRIVHPHLTDKDVASFLSILPAAYVDGQRMPFVSEGGNNFKYDRNLVVEETPMFLLYTRNAAGVEVPLGAPNVVGTGPLLSRRPPDLAAGRPRFGSYTRFHIAVVPGSAGAFDPDGFPEAVALLESKMMDPRAYRGRVANDRACFTMPTFPASCVWLDSQTRIEDTLGIANIRPTEVTACSPLVFYGGKGVGR